VIILLRNYASLNNSLNKHIWDGRTSLKIETQQDTLWINSGISTVEKMQKIKWMKFLIYDKIKYE